MLPHWLTALRRRFFPAPRAPRRPRRSRPAGGLSLEALEPRWMPAVRTWISPVGGQWTDFFNWSGGQVPQTGDDVVIPDLGTLGVADQTITAKLAPDTVEIASLTSYENVQLDSGTLVVNGPFLPTANGNLAFPQGALTLAGGHLADASVATGTQLTGTTGGGLLSDITLAGELTLAGSLAPAYVNIQGNLTLPVGGTIYLGDLAGTSAGELRFSDSDTTQVLSGGLVRFGGSTDNLISVENDDLTLVLATTILGGRGTITDGGYIDVFIQNTGAIFAGSVEPDLGEPDAHLTIDAAHFDNSSGFLEAGYVGARLTVAQTLANYTPLTGRLSGGTYSIIGGILDMPGTDVRQLDANVYMEGVSSAFRSGLVNALANLNTLLPLADLTLISKGLTTSSSLTIQAGASLSLTNGLLSAGGDITIEGTLVARGGTVLTPTEVSSSGGSVLVDSSGLLDVGVSNVTTNVRVPVNLSNQGTVRATGSTTTLRVESLPSDTAGTLPSGAYLQGGHWNVLDSAHVNFPSWVEITELRTLVRLEGADARITWNNSNNVFAELAKITTTGYLQLDNEARVTSTAALVNQGTLQLQSNSSSSTFIIFGQDYTQEATGSLIVTYTGAYSDVIAPLAIGGIASLAGTLAADSHLFGPADVVKVISYGGLSISANAFDTVAPATAHQAVTPKAVYLTGGTPVFVTTTADSGAGSLRKAIEDANTAGGAWAILFDIPTAEQNIFAPGTWTIAPASPLPDITTAIALDARTQPGYTGEPVIELAGTSIPFDNGLQVVSGGDFSSIRGLVINRFYSAITVIDVVDVLIQNNWIGTTPTGNATLVFEDNLLGNRGDGVFVGDSSYIVIGTNGDGVDDEYEGNVISGNAGSGVTIDTNSGVSQYNRVAGNLIGLRADGTDVIYHRGDVLGTPLGNGGNGVSLFGGASFNVIGTNGDGTSDDLERNVISGSSNSGVNISGTGTTGNVVAGNLIGTDITGTTATNNTGQPLGNAWDQSTSGIDIYSGATNTRIGTNADGLSDDLERNVISGNYMGLSLFHQGTTGNLVAGNYIGTNAAGDAALPNEWAGIAIWQGASGNTVGFTGFESQPDHARNVISGNNETGVWISDAPTRDNTLAGNYIGLTADGQDPLGNKDGGVWITRGASYNRVDDNVISGNLAPSSPGDNAGYGVFLDGTEAIPGYLTTGNVIAGNRIGTNADGDTAVPNASSGIRIGNAAGTVVQANVISGNTGDGLDIGGNPRGILPGLQAWWSDDDGTDLSGMFQHGNPAGNVPDGPGDGVYGDGFLLDGAGDYVTLGGSFAFDFNRQSFTLEAWVNPDSLSGTQTIFAKGPGLDSYLPVNYVLRLNGALPEFVFAGRGVSASIVGADPLPSSGFFHLAAVVTASPNGLSTDIHGDLYVNGLLQPGGFDLNLAEGGIGTNNQGLTLGARDTNTGGGTSYTDFFSGVIDEAAVYDQALSPWQIAQIVANGNGGKTFGPASVYANTIGLGADGDMPLGNLGHGIFIDGSGGNFIGGPGAGLGNIISANGDSLDMGVFVLGEEAVGNVIQNNTIGANAAGTVDRGNVDNGVNVFNAPGTRILDNLISGNDGHGILANGTKATGVLIQGNTIGTDRDGNLALGNDLAGIITSAPGIVISDGNLVSGNGVHGIEIIDANEAVLTGNTVGTNRAGTAAVPNGGYGVVLTNSSDSVVGSPGLGNLISGNAQGGVHVQGNGATALPITLGWWRADTTAEDALGQNNGAFHGTAAYQPGVTAGASDFAFGFDGSSAVVDLGAFVDFQRNSFSFDAWVMPTAADSTGVIFAQGPGDGSSPMGISYALYLDDGELGFRWFGLGGGTSTQRGPDLPLDVYTHVAVVVATSPGAGGATNVTATIYVNGRQWTSVGTGLPAGIVPLSGHSLTLGAVQTTPGVSDYAEFYTGRIDDAAVYGRALTAGEVARIHDLAGASKDRRGNRIVGNTIGTSQDGTTALGNVGAGVLIDDSAANQVGDVGTAGNHISGNTASGVHITGPGSTGNAVNNNFVGTDVNGVAALPNERGITVDFASDTIIGSSLPGGGNVISGNGADGVVLYQSGANLATLPGQDSLWKAESNALDPLSLVTGTLGGGASFEPGVSGQAFSFNGTNAYVDFGDVYDAYKSNSFSFDAWVQPSAGQTATILGRGLAPSGVDGDSVWSLDLVTGRLHFHFTDGIASTLDLDGPSLPVGLFSHVALVFTVIPGSFPDETLDAALYVNGVLVAHTTAPASYLPSSPSSSHLTLGALEFRGAYNGFFAGAIDEAGFYTRALTAPEIKDIFALGGAGKGYANGSTVVGNFIGTTADGLHRLGNGWDGLRVDRSPNNVIGGVGTAGNIISGNGWSGMSIDGAASQGNQVLGNKVGVDRYGNGLLPDTASWWKFESDLSDSVGGHDGSPSGTPVYSAAMVGSGLNFADDGATVTTPGPFVFNDAGDVSLEFWILPSGGAAGTVFWGKGDETDDANRFRIGFTAASTLVVEYTSPGGNGHLLFIGDTAVPLLADSWNHVALVRKGNVYTAYVDGQPLRSVTDVNPDLPNAASWTLSRATVGTGFTGLIDELTTYSRALTAADVLAIYNQWDAGKANDLGNSIYGLYLGGQTHDNNVGSAAAANIIGGNHAAGVILHDAHSNAVVGNVIGSDGVVGAGNHYYGVLVEAGSTANLVGDPGAGNVISGNRGTAIVIEGEATRDNGVRANIIGTDRTGLRAVPNDFHGVSIINSPGNTVGGPGAGNRIAGNLTGGINIEGQGAHGNTVQDNVLGLNSNGEGLAWGTLLWLPGEGDVSDAALGVGPPASTSGLVGYTTGVVGHAFAFDRAAGGGVVSVPDTYALNNSPLSLEAWIVLNSLPGAGEHFLVAGKGLTPVGLSYAVLVNDAGALQFQWGNGPTLATATGDTVLSPNSWHHLAVTASTGTGVQMYVNGSPVTVTGSAAAAWNYSGGLPLEIGGSVVRPELAYDGAIDELTLYERVLSASEIGDIYILANAGKPQMLGNGSYSGVRIADGAADNLVGGTAAATGNIIANSNGDGVAISGNDRATLPGTVAFWKGDANAIDYGPSGLHGGLLLGNTALDSVPGVSGPAFTFDGSTGSVEVADSTDWAFASGDFALEAWVMFDSLPSGQPAPLLAQDEGAGFASSRWVFAASDDALSFELHVGGVGGFTTSKDYSFSTGTWYQVAVRRASDVYTFFVNGGSIGSSAAVPVAVPDVAAPLTLGFTPSTGEFLHGRLDEIAVYNRALSDQDLDDLSVLAGASKRQGNRVLGNTIGLNASGEQPVASSGVGVRLSQGAVLNTVGGLRGTEGNTVAVPGGGIVLGDYSPGVVQFNTVQGNFVGTTPSGDALPLTSGQAIYLSGGASDNLVGGPQGSYGNVIGSYEAGVTLDGADRNRVQGNFINVTTTGTDVLGNYLGTGIIIYGGDSNQIGGVESLGNVIGGTTGSAVWLGSFVADKTVTNNRVQGNYLGVSPTMLPTTNLQLGGDGVAVWSLAYDNLIGGSGAGEGNVIGAGHYGVQFTNWNSGQAAPHDNLVQGNVIGTVDFPNRFAGVFIFNAPDNVIGGATAAAGNVIQGNLGDGVSIQGVGATGNVVRNNTIGDATVADNGNADAGVRLTSGASDNLVQDNTIAHNGAGVLVLDQAYSFPVFRWTSGPGANGHFYVPVTVQRPWIDAGFLAVQAGGYLATITSAEENAFLASTVLTNVPYSTFWLGLSNPTGAGYSWVTAEAFGPYGATPGLAPWQPGSPNTLDGNAAVATLNPLPFPEVTWLTQSMTWVNHWILETDTAPDLDLLADLLGTRGNTVSRNSIYGNGGPAIDLGNDGATLNDLGDADQGPNHLANFAVLTGAALAMPAAPSGGGGGGVGVVVPDLVVTGFARPGDTVELFLAEFAEVPEPPNSAGLGQGKTFLASFQADAYAVGYDGVYGPGPIGGVVVGRDSNVIRFRYTISTDQLPAGVTVALYDRLTATVTNAQGSTSEFGNMVSVGVSLTRVEVQGLPLGSVSEGTPVTLSGLASGFDLEATLTFDWQVSRNGTAYPSGNGLTFSFTPIDDGSYVLTLVVSDDRGNTTQAGPFTLTVVNAAPTVSLPVVPDRVLLTADPGTPGRFIYDIDLAPTVADAGAADTDAGLTYAWSVRHDGVEVFASSDPTLHYTADAAGQYSVTLTVTDKDDGVGESSVAFTAAQSYFSADITGLPELAEEGSLLTVGSIVTAPGASTLTYVWSVTRDGHPYGPIVTGPSPSFSFTPNDNDDGTPEGGYVVQLTVTDNQGGAATASGRVRVRNLPPTARITGLPDAPSAGQQISLTSDVGDPGAADVPTLAYHWQVSASTGQIVPDGVGSTFSFTPTAAGSYVVTLTVTDKDGASAHETVDLAVAAPVLAPVITGLPAADEDGILRSPEGTTLDLSALVEGGAPAGAIYTWTVLKDNQAFPFTVEPGDPAHIFVTPDDNGLYTVTLTVQASGVSGAASQTVTVTNVAPEASSTEPEGTILEGDRVSLSVASFADPGALDVPGLSFRWTAVRQGDDRAFPAGDGPTYSFVPTDNGLYDVVLTVTDKDGGSTTFPRTLEVANVAPSASIRNDSDAPAGSLRLLAAVTDPGTEDTFTYLWTVTTYVGASSSITTYTTPAVSLTPMTGVTFKVALTVTDKDDDTGSDSAWVLAGTSQDDRIRVRLEGGTVEARVETYPDAVPGTFDGPATPPEMGPTFSFARASVQRVLVLGLDGDDILDASTVPDTAGLPVDMDPGHGNNALVGGAGDNTYTFNPGSDSTIIDLAGFNTLSFGTADQGISFDLSLQGQIQPVNYNTLAQRYNTLAVTGLFQQLIGSAHADRLTTNVTGGVVFGGSGHDTLTATNSQNVSLFGGNDGSTLEAVNTVGASLFGGDGGDFLHSVGSRDVSLFGGNGSDVLVADVSLFGGDGPSGALPADVSLFGGDGIDSLTANVSLFGGNDSLAALQAADVSLFGGDGGDVMDLNLAISLFGGQGPVIVEPSAISLFGGAGDDRMSADVSLFGSAGAEVSLADVSLFGGEGDDELTAQVSLFGAAAAAEASALDVSLFGDDGSDRLTADVSLFGGNASLPGTLAADVSLFGGTGPDTLDLNLAVSLFGGASTTTDLSDVSLFGGDGDDRMSADISLFGGMGADTVSLADVSLFGGDGNDDMSAAVSLFGATAADEMQALDVSLFGGDGDDALTATGLSQVSLFGDDGDDHLTVNAVSLFGGTGTDTTTGGSGVLTSLFGGDGVAANPVLETDVSLFGGTGADTLDLNLAVSLFGGAGPTVVLSDVSLFGGDGNDVMSADISLFGGAAHDSLAQADVSLFGGEGDDLMSAVVSLFGATAADEMQALDVSLFGGDGNDNLTATGLSQVSLFGDDGNDWLMVNAVSLFGGQQGPVLEADVSLFGGAGSDTLDLNLAVSLFGGAATAPVELGDVSLFGGDGNDLMTADISLFGGTAHDSLAQTDVSLFGGDGNDVMSATVSLFGATAADETQALDVSLFGGDGNDALTATGMGQVSLFGDDGDDRLTVNAVSLFGGQQGPILEADVSLFGGTGADTLDLNLAVSLFGGSATSAVEMGDVSLFGGDGNDVMSADISLFGGAAHDSLSMTDVSLFGGEGDDALSVSVSLFGATAADEAQALDISLFGGAGNDTVSSTGASYVSLFGNDGNDAMTAVGGTDVSLFGGDGLNTLATTSSRHVGLFGGDDSDTLTALNATDATLFGGDGNDRVSVTGGNDVSLFGGAGDDSLTADMSLFGGPAMDSLSDSDVSLFGGTGDDSLDVNLAISLFGGNDSLANLAGDAVSLFGGDGHDVMTADVSLFGGDSPTELTAAQQTDVSLFGGAGDDALSAGVSLFGGALDDGSALSVSLFGNEGRDSLTGANLAGGLLFGGDDNDALLAQGGSAVSLFGGAGDDVLDIRNATDVSLFGNDGDDRLSSTGGSHVTLFGDAGHDTLTAISGQSLLLFGGDDSDALHDLNATQVSLFGGSGDDLLDNQAGVAVSLFGMDGDDALVNLGGAQVSLFGEAGDDLLTVLAGDTVSLFGGTGNDTIVIAGGLQTAGFGDVGSDNLAADLESGASLFGGPGNDVLTADVGAGNSDQAVSLFGEDGDDVYLVAWQQGQMIYTHVVAAEIKTTANLKAATESVSHGFDTVDFSTLPVPVQVDLSGSPQKALATDPELGELLLDMALFGQFEKVVGTAQDDVLHGNNTGMALDGGPGGSDSLVGGAGMDTFTAGSGNDTHVGGDGSDTYVFAGAVQGTNTIVEAANADSDTLDFSGLNAAVTVDLSSTEPQQVTAELGLVLTVPASDLAFTQGDPSSGIENVVGSRFGDSLTGNARANRMEGGRGDDELAGLAGHDTYVFSGANLGQDTLLEGPGGGSDTLDFSLFGSPVQVDLGQGGPQQVSPGNLVLVLDGGDEVLADPPGETPAFENVLGSAFADRILGNPLANRLLGRAGLDYLDGKGGADAIFANSVQMVYLDFTTKTTTGLDHFYADDERLAIQQRLQFLYAGLGVQFVTSPPASGEYATLFFNGGASGGEASDLDLGNVSLGGTATVDVNLLLGGQGRPEATKPNRIALTTTVAAHELGHLLGLRHADALGPIGSGLYSGRLAGKFRPTYAGPIEAEETPEHVMASPLSLGTPLSAAAGATFFGARELIKLGFADTGTWVPEAVQDHGSQSDAQGLGEWPGVVIPLADGVAWPAGVPQGIKAVAVEGSIRRDADGVSENDWYSFAGRAGDLVTASLQSITITRLVNKFDPVLELFGPDGTTLAFNDDEFESQDSLLVDVRLPEDGTYWFRVGGFSATQGGDYVLFAYRAPEGVQGSSAGGTSQGGGDTLLGGSGAELVGASGHDLFVLAGGTEGATVRGGGGGDTLRGPFAVEANVIEGVESIETTEDQAPPVLESIGPQAGQEGQPVTFTADADDADADDTLTYSLTAVDDSEALFPTGATIDPESGQFSWTPADNGTYQVRVVVMDSAGKTDTEDVTLTVENVAPDEVQASLDTSEVDEGGMVTLGGSFTDPGTADTHTVSIDWGDGSTPTVLNLGAGVLNFSGATHTYQDNPASPQTSYEVVVTVTDKDNSQARSSPFVSWVRNVEPELVALSLSPLGTWEGGKLQLDWTFTDPGIFDTHTVSVNWGDGSTPTVVNMAAGQLTYSGLTHTYVDNPASPQTSYEVVVTVTDKDGGSDQAQATVAVDNVAPKDVSLSLSSTDLEEGETLTLGGSFTDPGTADTHTVSIDWGDGSTPTVINLGAGVLNFSGATHTYQDNPASPQTSYEVVVTVTDKDGGVGQSAPRVVFVRNVEPELVALSLSPLGTWEGGKLQLDWTFTDPGIFDTHTVSVNWGDGSTPTVVNMAAGQLTYTGLTHTYVDNPASPQTSYEVVVTVTDKDSGSDQAQATVAVDNVAPKDVSLSLDAATINEGGTVTLGGTFTDPGTADTHTVSIDWGDGSPATVVNLGAGVLSFSGRTHTYADNPTGKIKYTITATVTDKDGASGQGQVDVTVSNVAPQNVTLTRSAASINEGGSVTLGGSFTDPGTADTHTVSINWGDGSPVTVVNLAAGVTTFGGVAHTYADNPASPQTSFPIVVTVADKDTGSDQGQTAVAVANLKPTATGLNNNGPVTAGASARVSFLGATDPSPVDAASLRYSIKLTAAALASTWDAASAAAAIDQVFASAGTYTVYGRVFDKDGASNDYQTTVTVNPAGAVDVSSRVSAVKSGLTYNRTDGLFYGSVTVTNTSSTAIAGGLKFVLQGLASGVSLTYASVTINGVTTVLTVTNTANGPMITVPKSLLASLGAGQSIKLNLRFRTLSLSTPISYTLKTWSDPTV